jgi:hypothetical protein
MTHIPYLFHQTTEQMRRIGARGGKTQARNRRARQRAAGAAPRETPPAGRAAAGDHPPSHGGPGCAICLVTRCREARPPAADRAAKLSPPLGLAQGRCARHQAFRPISATRTHTVPPRPSVRPR